MPQYDLPAHQLVDYRSSVPVPDDLDEFWTQTLTRSRDRAWEPKVELVDCGLELLDTYDVTFSGFDGEPIKAWYRRPRAATQPLPVLVRYIGYTGGRGLPTQISPWPLAGFATLDVDNRGQGTGTWVGDTPDSTGHGPASLGYLTRGLLDRDAYYYRRLFTDAVLAVDAAEHLPGADPKRIIVTGTSQGGGIALAVGGLRDDLTAVMADVPFLCDIPRAVAIAGKGPYLELADYLGCHRAQVPTALNTLSYFDGCVLGRTAQAPALLSVALMDTVCPPSTVYAAFNAYAGPKDLRVYPYNDHEGGLHFHEAVQIQWARALLSLSPTSDPAHP